MQSRLLARLRRIATASILVTAMLSCTGDTVAPRRTEAGVARVWRMAMPGITTRESYSQAVATESDFSFVTPDGELLLVSRADGQIRWRTRGPRSSPKRLMYAGGAIIYPGVSVASFSASDGSARWSFPAPSDVSGCDGASNASTTVVCTPGWNVTALNVATGAPVWSVSLRDSLSGLPTLVGTTISGDTVYAAVRQLYSTTVGYAQAIIFAMSLHDGTLLSLIREGDYTDFTGYIGTPRVVGRILIVPHLITNKLTGVDRFSGKVVWRLNGDPGWAGFVSIPTAVDAA
jgi:outer membrane protein assembly factor BamB